MEDKTKEELEAELEDINRRISYAKERELHAERVKKLEARQDEANEREKLEHELRKSANDLWMRVETARIGCMERETKALERIADALEKANKII